MRLLLISNSVNHGQGYLDHCESEILETLKGIQHLVFIPYALHNWDAYTEAARSKFRSLGISVSGIHEGAAPRVNAEQAEAFFTGGGNTFRLLKKLYECDLLDTVRQKVNGGAPYIGSSAGTNIACTSVHTTNDMPIVYPPSLEALDLVPFNINPHYLDSDPSSTHQGETREKRIEEFHEENSNVVVALREGSWLHRDGARLSLGGPKAVRIFRRGQTPEELPSGSDLSPLL